jgi:hypothetical protein
LAKAPRLKFLETDIDRMARASHALEGDERKFEELTPLEQQHRKHAGYRAALDKAARALSIEEAREAFAKQTQEFEAAAEKRDAIKRERDGKGDKLTLAEARKYDERIRKANEGLFELEMERAALARALEGRTA